MGGDELTDWIIANDHVDDAMKHCGMNAIQPVEAESPIALDNICYDPTQAKRPKSKCAGVKKVPQRKVFTGGNFRDADNYRLLRVEDWIAELRGNSQPV